MSILWGWKVTTPLQARVCQQICICHSTVVLYTPKSSIYGFSIINHPFNPCILHLTPSRTKVLLLAHHLECGEAAQTLDTRGHIRRDQLGSPKKPRGIPSRHHGLSYAKSWSDNWIQLGVPMDWKPSEIMINLPWYEIGIMEIYHIYI